MNTAWTWAICLTSLWMLMFEGFEVSEINQLNGDQALFICTKKWTDYLV